ncbi:YggS family pyridoxal phosphate-dependent enzyme [Ornithinibacillus sp. BX22]|uniref:Pyridoxal phosphate homeostasis protein n=2 Tax=Ornithinibacillus TaxID=484508 RepID=A0A923RG84_9BACI|nr:MULTISPECIES: YggS family pyridoxal phosphate-dependent enzyme [Ornithinibacillus]MBC5635884.1 YggS family pyridoxal phosphate-dependent enzyme [Ornithinibacillus hominis]MBS3680127.1 YggS family pyridoxal phosphate-dependent enzyme [Ornithinibacillus massiliensis]
MDVAQNLAEIKTKINEASHKVNRDPNEITIIAVTKYVTIERTMEAIEAGISDLGENRQEGFLEKYDQIQDNVTWHFIGSLQTRKVKDVINKVDYLHSLDRLSLAKEIEKRASSTVNCFIQVNVSGEDSKHGLHPDEVMEFVEKISQYTKIHIVGLMTMAPHTEDKELLHQVFGILRNLRDTIKERNYPFAPCEYLSMGMSNDYDIAIEEGATHIRIGSKLVGANK